jgi:hypothetical protein
MSTDTEVRQVEVVAEGGGSLEQVQIQKFENLSEEQIVRLFIFEKYADPDISGDTMVQNMDMIENWIMHGKVPRKSKLNLVKSEQTNE